jgi:multimeric flavodoxin WrbA
MHIVALAGTPHREKGNTARLAGIVLRQAGERGPGGGMVLPCHACGRCHKKGVCPQIEGNCQILPHECDLWTRNKAR